MSALEKGIARALDRGLPAPLAPVIRSFVSSVCELFASQNIGVLLVGSASRGEVSWHMTGDNPELFSDVEFLIGVDRHDRPRQAQLAARAGQITDTADLGPFFHIDYTFIEWSKLSTLDTKFFIFESKYRGIDLCASELAPLLPATTRANLNWKELNEILVHRLSAILHAIPKGYFTDDMNAHDNQQFALSLAKNTLDLTTWLHPYESKNLVAGYGNRVADWQQTGLEGLTLSDYFSDADIAFLRSCIALRQAPATSTDSMKMLQQTLTMYDRAIQYCLRMNHIAASRSLTEFHTSAKLFDEYRLRARMSQSLSVLRNLRSIGITKLVRNLVGVRRGLAVQICIDLVLAALQWTTDEQAALQTLSHARQNLSTVFGSVESKQTGFASQWLDTRALFAKYQHITHNY